MNLAQVDSDPEQGWEGALWSSFVLEGVPPRWDWCGQIIYIHIIKYGLEFMGPGVAGCGQGLAFGSGHIAR
jgi:hypothetical protein